MGDLFDLSKIFCMTKRILTVDRLVDRHLIEMISLRLYNMLVLNGFELLFKCKDISQNIETS